MLPLAFECCAGSFHGDVDVFLCAFVDGDDGLLVVRVDCFEGLPVNTFDEFVVDEPCTMLVTSGVELCKVNIQS